ncbi:rhamnosyltransferase [Pontibacter mucosus]|uniref:Rhamnosyltransferase n=1 Tax=Pontibacter mucosus TaxID=1649266 RepID=A0A2T5YDW8_9BACT|nr:glycosyltransferase family 2 protein [Pontibacter mucosus]PTX14908.1 rhamnosyltransferase [Pontibacter mucosus]
MFHNIAGVVVLYKPDAEVVDNIQSYSDKIGKLYVVDNSNDTSDYVVDALRKSNTQVDYIGLKKNHGIAWALNIAASKALAEGFSWLLMMDQDSKFSENMVKKLIATTSVVETAQIGIIAPRYLEDDSIPAPDKLEEAYSVITSGSLLNLNAYKEVGPFRDNLFIDFVDHEYCLRLLQHQYKIVVNNEAKLHHKLGNLSCHNLFGWKLCTSNHSYVRRYYITRNRLEILHKFKDQFPEFLATEKNKNLVEIVKVLLFEKDKFRKLKSFIHGYIDFKRKKFGEYSHR